MEVRKKIQKWVELEQALTNQILSDVHSHSPVLQYLSMYFHIKIFVHVDEAENTLHVFLISALYYLCNIRIYIKSRYINICFVSQHFMYFHFETFVHNICNIFSRNLFIFNGLFFS